MGTIMLNAKQTKFVEEYMVDLNATQAAIRAGYSEKSASAIGHENLSKPEIQSELSKRIQERSQRTQVDADWVVENLVGNHTRAVETDELGHSNKALELLGKNCGMFTSKLDVEHSVNVTIIKPEEREDE